jgi:undecaprenyl diphosphate synthase
VPAKTLLQAQGEAASETGSGAPFGVRHVAIIMDGNGRWAAERGLPRVAGHRAGVEAVRRLIKAALERKLDVVTIYSFSTENWSRPKDEVSELMRLLQFFIRSDLKSLHQQNVRIKVIGAREGLGADLVALVEEAERVTAANSGMTLVVAFNYGARDEILRATRKLALDLASGALSGVSEADFASALDTSGIPDPDLLIRTSGEQRLSNFLLWQSAYTEFVFSPVLWPDFSGADLDAALAEFGQRVRRFGGV